MTATDKLQNLLQCQRRGFRKQGNPSLDIRQGRIKRTIAMLVDNQQALCDAINVDFHGRSAPASLYTDIHAAITSLKYACNHMAANIKVEQRYISMPERLLGASASVHYQPKGVVGAVSTWHLPIAMPMAPLGAIFAAGNRCMIKLSEQTPHSSLLLEKLIGQYFDQEELVAVNGDARVGEAFSQLAFDHLLFSGAAHTGKQVVRAAAEQLVPVTLALGGKSPVIIGKDADLKKTAEKIVISKSLNAGQSCLSPDYVFVKEASLNELIAELERAYARYFPTLLNNPDYGSVINAEHYHRLMNYLNDAKQKNGEIWEINPARENFFTQNHSYKIAPTLVINPSDDMLIMQEEILGPLLPIKSYHHIDEVSEYIESRPRALALYYFGKQQTELERVLDKTMSSSVTVNDVIRQIRCEDVPCHGIEGFKTFSHARYVYKQSPLDMMTLAGLTPPYTNKTVATLMRMIKK